MGFLVNLFNKIFFLIRVLPQIKKFHISGPIDNKIQLFTDESIECLFTLNNNAKDCVNLRNVRLVFLFALFKLVTIFFRVLCQKIYREEEQINQPQNVVVQYTFNAVNPIDLNMNPTFGHQTLVPVFSQEVATFLGQWESVISRKCQDKLTINWSRQISLSDCSPSPRIVFLFN